MADQKDREKGKDEKDGLLYMWQGYHGDVEVVKFPALFGIPIRKVAIGTDHSVFLTLDGRLFSCGSNVHGQLGVITGDKDQAYDPVQVSGLSDVQIKDVACGCNHSAAVSRLGQVYCWGDSREFQCASTEKTVTVPQLVPVHRETSDHCQHGVPIEDQVDIVEVSCGKSHTVALSGAREVWVWGSGEGLGIKQKYTASPVLLERLVGRNVLGISCGFSHTLAVIERSILEDSYSPVKTRRSRASETNTHKILPKTCAKCNSEIYTYQETNDTCIINDEHLCKCDNESELADPGVGQRARCDSDVFESVEDSDQRKTKEKLGAPQINDEHHEEEDIWVKQETIPTSESAGNSFSEHQGMQKCPGSNRLSATKSVSFVNEEEARKYLAEQYEDKTEEEECPQQQDTPSTSTLGSLLSSVQMYPSDVISHISAVPQQMSSMTSKALSSITDKLGFSADNRPRDTTSESSGMGSQLFLAFDTSEEDLRSQGVEAPDPQGVEDPDPQALMETSFISDSGIEGNTNRLSLRTIEAKQENLSKKATIDQLQVTSEATESLVTLETEVWSWGKNNKGQLGHGDEIDRERPEVVRMLIGTKVVKVCGGGFHSLALTADSKVYSWGLNASGQLARTDNTAKPCPIKLMDRCYAWDIAAGEKFSVFLMDRDGFQPEIHYVGKHPCRDLYVPIYKTNRLTCLNFLKQAGWVRAISAGEDNSACISCWSFTGFTASLFEVAAAERRFYSFLNCILSSVVHPLKESSFFSTLDVFPYKSCTQNLLAAFENITNLIGENSVDLTNRIRSMDNFLEANFFVRCEEIINEFKVLSISFADMLAIGGFDYLCKTGKQFFDSIDKELQTLLDGSKYSQKNKAEKLQVIFDRPFSHIKEYCRLTEKLVCNYEAETPENCLLSRVTLQWQTLKRTTSTDHRQAKNTKVFWEALNFPKLIDAVKIPTRRLVRGSRDHPLSLYGAGRMSTHDFFLFNDLFVHAQYSAFQTYPLETLWIETPENEKQRNLISLITPEETLVLSTADSNGKTEWLIALNSTINKVLSRQKSVTRRGSHDRLTPPDIRFANHQFIKHGVFKGATYSGYWLSGKLHGFGEMKWADGRKYVGHFKEGLQHGHGKLILKQNDGSERTQEGYWRDGLLHGLAKVRYSNGDLYEGAFKDGQRHGHGIYRQGQHASMAASVYIGEWVSDKKHGYGIMDDVMKGEKYMGMWQDDVRQGSGIVVTLDGMYFEGNFTNDKLTGFGLMMTYDNSCYEGEFAGITQLQGKGKLRMPNRDTIEGMFSGSWNEGLKINGVFKKAEYTDSKKTGHRLSQIFGTMAVPANQKWEGMFQQCINVFRVKGQDQLNTQKAWENVAVTLSKGKKNIREIHPKYEGMQHTSESVFVGLCEIVGTSQQVALRRETEDIKEMVDRRVTPNDWIIKMLSGSKREGFRLKGSDVDSMHWPNNHRVIMDMSQSEYYNTANTTLILSDSTGSPPGFTLLQLLTPTIPVYRKVQSSCVRMNDRVYISSSIYRQLTCSAVFPNSTVHGPCGSGVYGGVLEYDHAHCFVGDFWPVCASSWIHRCHSWPDPEVVNDIVRNGCHFVAIGHPLGPHGNREWRISFSLAEYKLVSSMNHCQFLTYGLLKLFLKEVINHQLEESNKLLCSYHMKTTVFWAIQQNTLPQWCPQNLLASFWVCFKLLLRWVYEGVCPNFFIPQNNLFLTKVHGSAQNRLFLQLHELYKKGLACLLQSSSIRSYIIGVLYNPRLSICTDESMMRCEVDYDVELVYESSKAVVSTVDLFGSTKVIHTIEQLVESPLTHYQVVTIQSLTASLFQCTAFQLQKMYTNTGCNKQMYIADKMSCHMLKLAAKFGCISDMLYIAMYYYKTLRYREALSVIEMTKVKLAQPYLMYDGHVDRERYTEAVGGKSWSTKIRQAVARDINLENRICYISELIPEQQSALQNKDNISCIPVFVMLDFLEFLCYRHIDTTLSQAALDELQVLVHHDQGLYVDDILGDISWEILGICQQITGNLQAALYSYQQSLTQYPLNDIQTATHRRIQDIVRTISHQ